MDWNAIDKPDLQDERRTRLPLSDSAMCPAAQALLPTRRSSRLPIRRDTQSLSDGKKSRILHMLSLHDRLLAEFLVQLLT